MVGVEIATMSVGEVIITGNGVVPDWVESDRGVLEMPWVEGKNIDGGQRVMVEEINLVTRNDCPEAFDMDDDLRRWERLSDQLSEFEREQVVRRDMRSGLTAHVVEIMRLAIMPYEMVVRENELGADVVIWSDEGGKRVLFRNMEKMMKAREVKTPVSSRDVAVRSAFVEVQAPMFKVMNEGDVLVFFSPQNFGGEREHWSGMMYVVRVGQKREGVKELVGLAVRVDFDKEEYERVLDSLGVGVDENKEGDEWYAEVVRRVLYYPRVFTRGGVSRAIEDVLVRVRSEAGGWRLNGERIDDVTEWIEQGVLMYEDIRGYVGGLADEMVDQVLSGNSEVAKRMLRQIQRRVVKSYNPRAYWEAMEVARRTNEPAVIKLDCGLLPVGYADPMEQMMRGEGVGGEQVKECVELKCRACGNTKIEKSDVRCRVCGWAPGKSVEEYRSRHQKRLETMRQRSQKGGWVGSRVVGVRVEERENGNRVVGNKKAADKVVGDWMGGEAGWFGWGQ